MWGRGDYSLHTKGAKDVIDNSTGSRAWERNRRSGCLRREAVAFQIADYGAADGGTSIDLQRKVVGAVRERAPTRPICVTYTDLPRNDYSALFTNVHGDGPDAATYMREHDGVFVYASATSFFEPIFPDGIGGFRILRHRHALAEQLALPGE